MNKPVPYFEKLESGRIKCTLCPMFCRLREGQRGICRSRMNLDGQIVTDNYGELVTLAVDPIEKKPLYHFYPGTEILSTGPNCCNLGCLHCQNWSISQEKSETRYMSPEDLVEVAKKSGTIGAAFTYTEPLMWFEYLLDVAPLLREAGQKVVLVSNGFINTEPLEELLPYVDAANIDLKSMDQDFYRKVCKAKLDPVKDTIVKMHQAGVHLEITNLVIPELNDAKADIEALVDFVAGLSEYIPLHFSAYYPSYKLDKPPTPPSKLQEARETALKKLKYVFLGNVRLTEGADSNCPQCGNKLVERSGYAVKIQGLDGSKCRACGFDSHIIR